MRKEKEPTGKFTENSRTEKPFLPANPPQGTRTKRLNEKVTVLSAHLSEDEITRLKSILTADELLNFENHCHNKNQLLILLKKVLQRAEKELQQTKEELARLKKAPLIFRS